MGTVGGSSAKVAGDRDMGSAVGVRLRGRSAAVGPESPQAVSVPHGGVGGCSRDGGLRSRHVSCPGVRAECASLRSVSPALRDDV